MAQILPPGSAAPGFNLHVTPYQMLSLNDLADLRTKSSFSPSITLIGVPSAAINWRSITKSCPSFTITVGISVDSHWCHAAFAKDRHLHFPLLSDFEPKGGVAKQYGAYRDGEGVCERALFVIDKHAKIFWSYLSPIAVNPGADGILEALEKMSETKSHVHVESARHSG